MRAYEIHTYQDGRWKIDAVFDDRALAVFEAKRMDDGNRFSGVRVIEETFDEATDKATARTIFRGGRAENLAYKKEDQAAKGPKKRTTAARGGTRDHVGGQVRKAKKKKSGFTGPLVVLAILVIVGLGGLFGLQQLFALG